jgi:hypothetical protein
MRTGAVCPKHLCVYFMHFVYKLKEDEIFGKSILVLIKRWKYNLVRFYTWRHDLRQCLLMMYRQRYLTHSIIRILFRWLWRLVDKIKMDYEKREEV